MQRYRGRPPQPRKRHRQTKKRKFNEMISDPLSLKNKGNGVIINDNSNNGFNLIMKQQNQDEMTEEQHGRVKKKRKLQHTKIHKKSKNDLSNMVNVCKEIRDHRTHNDNTKECKNNNDLLSQQGTDLRGENAMEEDGKTPEIVVSWMHCICE